MGVTHDIFISYSSEQKSIADGVCHYLEENGFKCWMAPRDIPVGSEYFDLIEEAINASKVVVLVFSETASISKWVINVAFIEDKAILPFRVDETEVNGGFSVMLNQMHWIDTFPQYADRLPDLLNSIAGLVGKPARKVNVSVETTNNGVKIVEKPTNIVNGHEYVDLGMPSGTLWATCNVGADMPEKYGNHYSWDEGKKVVANWGNGWDVPSKEQWEELEKKTKSTWTTRNGVNGRLFTANNGNSIFLPAAGFRAGDGLEHAGSEGYYYSSSLNTSDRYGVKGFFSAWYFDFESDYYGIHNIGYRSFERSVRPVCSSPQN